MFYAFRVKEKKMSNYKFQSSVLLFDIIKSTTEAKCHVMS